MFSVKTLDKASFYSCKRCIFGDSYQCDLLLVKSCLMPVGVEDGRIPDEAFTASSSYSSSYLPNRGRLNLLPSGGKYCWAAGQNNVNQWLQVWMITVHCKSALVESDVSLKFKKIRFIFFQIFFPPCIQFLRAKLDSSNRNTMTNFCIPFWLVPPPLR